MLALSTLGWLLRTALRSPAIWLLLILVGATWPTLQVLMSLGITTSSKAPLSALWQLGFLSSLIGSSVGMYGLCKQSWWLQRTSPAKTALVEVLTIGCLGFLFTLAAWLLAVPGIALRDLIQGLYQASFACLHAALLGSLFLRALPGITPGASSLVLPVVGWLIPGWWPGGGLLARCVHQSCDLARYFEFLFLGESPAPDWPYWLLPIMALSLFRLALALHQTPAPCVTPSSETSTPT